mgnify:CR=1 FL=1
MTSVDQCQRIFCMRVGGPKPCGCVGYGHKPWCEKAPEEERQAWRKRQAEWLTKLIGPLTN